MTRTIAAICAGIVFIAAGGTVPAVEGLRPEPRVMPPAVQVIQPQMKILERPVIIQVQVEPSLGVDTSMRILCATSAYRGQVHVQGQDVTITVSISGEIRELSQGKVLVSFDVEAQWEDISGAGGFAGSGAAILQPPKSKTVLTIGGKSLILTVTFPPEEAPAEKAAGE